MTKKDYVRIAKVFRVCAEADVNPRTLRYVAEEFAAELSADNPNFNRGRFLAACGVSDNA